VVYSIFLCGSIVYSVFVVIIFVYLFRFLTSGIRALSLIDIVDKYFLFLQIFFFEEEKKEGHDIPEIFCIFMCKFCRNRLYI
jgi:hypothetical protein